MSVWFRTAACLVLLGACSTPAGTFAAAFSLPDVTTDLVAPADSLPGEVTDLSDTPSASDASADAAEPVVDVASVDVQADAPKSVCAGMTCSGHGQCLPLYDAPYCKCDNGFYLTGTTTCADASVSAPCNPNPCVEPDKGTCDVAGAKAVCSCSPGFYDVGGVCTFINCPTLQARTGVIVYDATGSDLSAGFDPLQPGDTVQIRIEIEVLSGSGDVVLELHPYNLGLLPDRLACDGAPCKATTKGPLFDVALSLTAGAHSVELTGTFQTNLAPLGLSARLAATAGCEIPGSRSAARIGALGVLDAKGFDCIDLDRTRSIQVTHDVAEKNTAAYGAANGQATGYQPTASIVSQVVQCFTRKTAKALFLAGDPGGVLPWAVDNDMIIERYDAPPQPGDLPVAVIGIGTDAVSAAQGPAVQQGPKPDVPGIHFGIPNGAPFGFSAGHVRLDELVPPGKQVWLRFLALDYGVVGRLTRLYVLAVPPSEAPRRCLDNSHCAGWGCVEGQCSGGPCDSSNPCAVNQFCVGGLCTSRCDQGGGACDAALVCKVRGCVAPGTPGVCDASQQDQDCPKGEVCHWGRCEPGCHHPRKQDQSYAYDAGNGFCFGEKPTLCPHCALESQGCWNNVCSACEVDAACAVGQVCVDRACVAVW